MKQMPFFNKVELIFVCIKCNENLLFFSHGYRIVKYTAGKVSTIKIIADSLPAFFVSDK